MSRGNSEGNSYYLLRGRHGKTRVCAKQPSPDIEFTGVVDVNRMHETASDISELGSEKESTLLFESRIKSPVHVTLVKDVIIPGKTEVMLEGRLEKKVACKTGIISSRLESDQSHIHIANSPDLNERDKRKLNALLDKFTDVFNDQITECTITKHKINTGDAMPIKQ